MPYQLFLQTLSQLSYKGTAALELDYGTIHIQSVSGKDAWRISMPLCSSLKSRHLSSTLSSLGTLRWQQTGARLELDSDNGAISLVDEIEIKKDRYISFKKEIERFIQVSQEWKEILASLK